MFDNVICYGDARDRRLGDLMYIEEGCQERPTTADFGEIFGVELWWDSQQ